MLLADQDRDRWDQAPGRSRASPWSATCTAPASAGSALQAAIAAVHAVAPRTPRHRWGQVVALYDALLRGVAVAGRRAEPGRRAWPRSPARRPRLAEVDRLTADGRLAGYRYLPATRADLLRRLGRTAEAATAYDEALTLTDNEAERAFLIGRRDDARRL